MNFILELSPDTAPYYQSNLPDLSCNIIALAAGVSGNRAAEEVNARIARLLGPTGAVPYVTINPSRRRGGYDDYSTNVPILDWLATDAWHSDNLANSAGGMKYVGLYYPAILLINNSGYYVYASSSVAFSCAHCAMVQAIEIASRLTLPSYITRDRIKPSVVFSPDANKIPEFSLVPEIGSFTATSLDAATVKLPVSSLGAASCSHCGFPGHNSRGCPHAHRDVAHDKVGVEIEGRFLNLSEVRDRLDNDNIPHCGDGSIRRGLNPIADPHEIQTRPGSLMAALKQVVEYYPDETDDSCGMHVHVSFKDMSYFTQLCHPEFFKYFVARWRAWGESRGINKCSSFWARLNGSNEYCRPNKPRDAEIAYSSADRYLHLNFHAYDEHRTVECRLLPMFTNASLAVDAITELVNIYEDWLARDADKLSDLPEFSFSETVNSHPAIDDTLDVDIGTSDVGSSVSDDLCIELEPLQPISPEYTRITRAFFRDRGLNDGEVNGLLRALSDAA